MLEVAVDEEQGGVDHHADRVLAAPIPRRGHERDEAAEPVGLGVQVGLPAVPRAGQLLAQHDVRFDGGEDVAGQVAVVVASARAAAVVLDVPTDDAQFVSHVLVLLADGLAGGRARRR
ncbi:hypothetical protein [Streptomyces scabiei]|uniref:hypothetical protein n=1 Tax=Streptomyces scabiei TaxID=1930 RepID=UPI001F369759|nr:hypothetical protein [Streptomyces scabiei]